MQGIPKFEMIEWFEHEGNELRFSDDLKFS